VTDEMIADILGKHDDLKAASSALIEKANENGGPDNVTCVLARWMPA
jgi:serine/threonine protein phosphatase PrpC